MEALLIVLIALLAGGMLYLFIQQRNFQRVDYEQMLGLEEREKQLRERIKMIDALLLEMRELYRQEQAELERISAITQAVVLPAMQPLAATERETPVTAESEPLHDPHRFPVLDLPGEVDARSDPASSGHVALAEAAQRRRRIERLVAQGIEVEEIAAREAVSIHEVELVARLTSRRLER